MDYPAACLDPTAMVALNGLRAACELIFSVGSHQWKACLHDGMTELGYPAYVKVGTTATGSTRSIPFYQCVLAAGGGLPANGTPPPGDPPPHGVTEMNNYLMLGALAVAGFLFLRKRG